MKQFSFSQFSYNTYLILNLKKKQRAAVTCKVLVRVSEIDLHSQMVSRTSFSVSNQSKNEMIFSCLNVFIILISCRRRSSSSGDLPSFGINFKATN